jgi:hypothetical protein
MIGPLKYFFCFFYKRSSKIAPHNPPGSAMPKQQDFRAKGIDSKPALRDLKTLFEQGDSSIPGSGRECH